MVDFPAACFGGRGISVARGRFRGLRPAAASYRNRKFKIAIRAAACGGRADSATNCGPPPPPGCGPHGLFKAEIQNSRFKIQHYRIGAQLAKKPHTSGLADANSEPSTGEFAVSSKPQIHDSKLKEAAGSLGYYSRSSRSLRSDRTSKRELRAFAAGGCGPHDLLRGRFQ